MCDIISSMNKTKILVLFLVIVMVSFGIGLLTFMLLQPKSTKTEQSIKTTISSVQGSSTLTKKSTFENKKEVGVSTISSDYENISNSKKFRNATEIPIKETDLNIYSKVRNELLIYSDDFDSADCESFILTINSGQTCYISFRKEILESEISKIRASIVSVENSDGLVMNESVLNCKMLGAEINPNKNVLKCETENLRLVNSGNYNMTLSIAGDELINTLEKNIEVSTIADFQQKYSDQVEN
jgi:hypothetical protein